MKEVDHEDIKVILFSQSLAVEARRWFTSIPDNSMLSYQAFEDSFKNKWADKKDPKKCLSQFNSMKMRENESVQEFYERFMKVYNAILAQFKPLSGASQLQYVEAFNSEFTLLLSERRSTSLADMMKDSIEVEVNLIDSIKKRRDEGEWRIKEGDRRKDKDLEQPSSSSSQEDIIDTMMKSIQRLT